jgi:O-antigen/teichoic acid export membrane protein
MAIMPYCFRLWEKEGMARTQGFVATSASRYALVAFPAIALYCAVSPTVLLIFASKKYIGSVGVIPWVVAGQVLWQGFFPMVGMGYHVRKRTGAFTKVQVVGVILNVGLNFLLVPRMGILGSAVATFATCVAVVVMTGIGSQHQLHVDWEWGSLLRALTAAVVVGLLMVWLPLGAGVLAALFRVVLGAALYTRLVTPLDGNAQWLALAGMKWLREHGLGGRWMYWLTGLSTARTEPVG